MGEQPCKPRASACRVGRELTDRGPLLCGTDRRRGHQICVAVPGTETLRALRRGALLNQQITYLGCSLGRGLRHGQRRDIFCAAVLKDLFRATFFIAIAGVNRD